MKFPSREQVKRIKEMYPIGTQVVVDCMNDSQAVPSGTVGTIYSVDDIGQIHCEEFGLALIYGVDRFHKVGGE